MTNENLDNMKGIRPKKRKRVRPTDEERLKHWVELGFSGEIGRDGVWIHYSNDISFKDTGDSIYYFGPLSDEAIVSMLEAARKHGWEEVEFFGDENFKSRAYRLACLMDPPLKVSGYDMPQHLKKTLDIPNDTTKPEPGAAPEQVPTNSHTL